MDSGVLSQVLAALAQGAGGHAGQRTGTALAALAGRVLGHDCRPALRGGCEKAVLGQHGRRQSGIAENTAASQHFVLRSPQTRFSRLIRNRQLRCSQALLPLEKAVNAGACEPGTQQRPLYWVRLLARLHKLFDKVDQRIEITFDGCRLRNLG